MEITAKLDYSVIGKMIKAETIGKKCIERAERDAVSKGKTELSKNIRQQYNMKKADIDSFIKKKNSSLDIESRNLTIGSSTHFTHTPKSYISQANVPVKRRKKVSVQVKKGKKVKASHMFITNPEKVKNTMVWERIDKKHIQPVRTLSAAAMASNKDISDKTMNVMQETMIKRLEHYTERELNRIADH